MSIIPSLPLTPQARRLASLALRNALEFYRLSRIDRDPIKRDLYRAEMTYAKRSVRLYRALFVLPVQAVRI